MFDFSQISQKIFQRAARFILLLFKLQVLFADPERPLWVDSVEKVEISRGVALKVAATSDPINHVKWLFGSALSIAALSVG